MAQPKSAQQREFDKYYLPWLRSTPSGSIGSTSCCRDTTLTALAQLATLRLQVDTATISLVDDENRVLLAKAGRYSPLRLNIKEVDETGVQSEPSVQPRYQTLDHHVFGSTWRPSAPVGETEELHTAFVSSGGVKDARLADTVSQASGHQLGSFAGVPIFTNRGHAIGVIAVSDPSPRLESLTVLDIKFLQDVAQIVFDHLDRTNSRMNRMQGENLVKGLTSFMEGLSTFKHELRENESAPIASQLSDQPDSDTPRATDPQDTSTRGRSYDRAFEAHETTPSAGRSMSASVEHSDATELKHGMDTSTSTNQNADVAVNNMKQVFERAALSIREATGARGCVFFDASPSLFAGASSAQPARAPSTDSSRFALESDSSDDETSGRSHRKQENSLGGRIPTISRRLSGDTRRQRGREPAIVLGASIARSEVKNLQQSLTQRELKRCLQHYPYGEWFWLAPGESAAINTSAPDAFMRRDEPDGLASKLHDSTFGLGRRFRGLPESLLKDLPDAKWLIFLPLFNYAQQQWYAGGFVWSNEPDFHGLDTHIPYLKAFGSCIMSEVTGMEAMNTSFARTTFIASISHDLRSPLHGMLGNLEFLEDTLNSAYQVSLAGSIETCGKTLLDTIDHLLDYAKINNLNRATDSHDSDATNDRKLSRSAASKPSSSATFDLALLLEEVTEAAFAGQTFRKKNLRGYDDVDRATDAIHSLGIDDSKTTEQTVHQGSAKFSGRVFFIVDIQHMDSWLVSSDSPGAIRRIILNIIGNAIKYCNAGIIEAKLWKPQIRDGYADVKISINDTGIGMSQAFLENHLFKAFSQEDSFSAGAGLGLSIARQLMDKMHGNISVKSEKGVGTHVDISVPLHFDTSEVREHQDILQAAERITRGKRICLLNPGNGDGIISDRQNSKLTASIADMCEDWFKLEFAESTSIDTEPDTDIFVYAEPPPIEYLIQHHSERRAAGNDGREAALLIVCTNAFEAAALRSAGVSQLVSLGRIIEVISQPVGVRKMAKVLLSSLQRIEASVNTEATSVQKETFAMEAKQNATDTAWSSSPVVYDPISKALRPSIEAIKWKSEQPQVWKPNDRSDFETADLEFGQIKAGALPQAVPMLPRTVEGGNGETRMPRVLAVDDNPINLRLLVTFMKKIKLPYAEAVNGLEAYTKFKEAKDPFDFVLMDLQMPVMDGLESTRKIREHEKQVNSANPATIIAITGVGNESVKNECMESGMTQFLTKPVKFKTLQQLLERHNNS